MPSSPSSNLPSKRDVIYHPALVWLFRILVGATFIVSGFAKSIDPWGSFYKISEYLDVWGWDIPHALVVLGAFALGCSEFVLGCLLFFGCYRRVGVWLMMLMMCFMLPLTLYIAIASPVADCGCFGDFLVISNNATFVKNIFLTLMLVYLIMFNARVEGLFVPYVQWVIGGLLSLYIFIVSLIGFNVQPMIDFRRFAPETSLIPDDSESSDEDDVDYEFIYEKDGREETFSIDNLPDSTWTFVDRKVIGGDEALSDGFSVIVDDEDIAADIIDPDNDQFLVTIPDLEAVDLSYTYLLNELNDYITERGGTMVALVNGDEKGIDWWKDISMASYPIYSAEPTMIKELARGYAAIIYLHKGQVKWKRTLSSISYSTVTDTPAPELLNALDPEPRYYLNLLTLFFGGVIFVIMVLDRSGRLVSWHIRRRKSKRVRQSSAKKTPEDTAAVSTDNVDSTVAADTGSKGSEQLWG